MSYDSSNLKACAPASEPTGNCSAFPPTVADEAVTRRLPAARSSDPHARVCKARARLMRQHRRQRQKSDS